MEDARYKLKSFKVEEWKVEWLLANALKLPAFDKEELGVVEIKYAILEGGIFLVNASLNELLN